MFECNKHNMSVKIHFLFYGALRNTYIHRGPTATFFKYRGLLIKVLFYHFIKDVENS